MASQAAKHGIYVLRGDSIPETMETKHKVVIKATALPRAVNATLINEKEQHCAPPKKTGDIAAACVGPFG